MLAVKAPTERLHSRPPPQHQPLPPLPNAPDLPQLTPAQLEVMHVIWERGEATVTDIWSAIRKARKVARATIQTLIQRLEEKGWLSHREIGQAFVYAAMHPREATEGQLVTNLLDTAFGGSTAGLVRALLHDRTLDADEANTIRAMIAAAGSSATKRGTKKEKNS